MKVYPPEKTKSTYLYGDGQPSAWERYAVRALVSVVVGNDYRRHIRKARLSAQGAETAEVERKARAERRAEINRSVELSREQRRKAARV